MGDLIMVDSKKLADSSTKCDSKVSSLAHKANAVSDFCELSVLVCIR